MRKLGILSVVALGLLQAECKPPICTVAGVCPEDLVGEDVVNGTTTDGGTATNE